MCQNELIRNILEEVAAVTEINKDRIISKNRYVEVVDARHLAIYLMYRHHIPKHRIAEYFNLTYRNIHYILEHFETRLSYGDVMLKTYLNEIEKRLK